MPPALVAFLASSVVFVGVDLVWLTLAGPRLYRPALGPLLADRPNLAAAAVFYLIYLCGIFALAVSPALRAGAGWRSAALSGLALGIVAYATYDLTNQATLRLWQTRLSLIDIAWGGLLTGFAAASGYLAAQAVR